MENKEKIELSRLIVESLDGTISPERLNRLDQVLSQSREAVAYYVQHVRIYSTFVKPGKYYIANYHADDTDVFDMNLWNELLHEEQMAPALEIKEPMPELIQKVERQKVSYKLSKSNIVSLLLSAAAILFIVLFVKYAPQRPYSVDVATLTDQINVQWGQPEMTFDPGSRLWTNEGPLDLKKGVVEIQFDDGVEVVIEGPAVFEIERMGVFLDYGRLYSRVSETGLGFTIKTPTSQFVDMGTEFGIKSDIDGSSELHVLKGKVQLFAGQDKASRKSQMVIENKAVRFNSSSSQIRDIPIENEAFARQVNSHTGMIWRGQKTVDLADIVGGGNGFSKAPIGCGYNPENGAFRDKIGGTYDESKQNPQQYPYTVITGNPFIDGVFLPDGEYGPIQLNSAGDRTNVIGDTCGRYHFDITNGPALYSSFRNSDGTLKNDLAFFAGNLQLDGTAYGTRNNSGIYMFANSGISFDLDAIRGGLERMVIDRFTAQCGIPDQVRMKSAVREELCLDLHVFLDGRLCYEKVGMDTTNPTISLDIPVARTDRFLTLVVTDHDGEIKNTWCIFGAPSLTLK